MKINPLKLQKRVLGKWKLRLVEHEKLFWKGIGALDLEDYQDLAGQGWAEDI